MATILIPTAQDDTANYEQQVDLDGTTYKLVFEFNVRDGFWYLDILTPTDTPIRHGIKIVSDFPLLRLITGADRPPGEAVAADPSNSGVEAGLNDLGGAVQLVYIEEVSLPAGA